MKPATASKLWDNLRETETSEQQINCSLIHESFNELIIITFLSTLTNLIDTQIIYELFQIGCFSLKTVYLFTIGGATLTKKKNCSFKKKSKKVFNAVRLVKRLPP